MVFIAVELLLIGIIPQWHNECYNNYNYKEWNFIGLRCAAISKEIKA